MKLQTLCCVTVKIMVYNIFPNDHHHSKRLLQSICSKPNVQDESKWFTEIRQNLGHDNNNNTADWEGCEGQSC